MAATEADGAHKLRACDDEGPGENGHKIEPLLEASRWTMECTDRNTTRNTTLGHVLCDPGSDDVTTSESQVQRMPSKFRLDNLVIAWLGLEAAQT